MNDHEAPRYNIPVELLDRLPVQLPPVDSLRGRYIAAALAAAVFEWDEADKQFYGYIAVCPGVWAYEATADACRAELASALDDWVTVGLRHGQAIPIIAGIDLNPQRVP